MVDPHTETVSSPAQDAALRAAASHFMPRAQVGEHYGNCIRLAAENKITYKNAFDLHLIDFMGEMILQEDASSFRVSFTPPFVFTRTSNNLLQPLMLLIAINVAEAISKLTLHILESLVSVVYRYLRAGLIVDQRSTLHRWDWEALACELQGRI